jgi:DNA mismatch endonuclease (patch repair protein)
MSPRRKVRRLVPVAPPASSAAVAAAMRGNRRVDTRPEMRVRRLLHSLGYRYRLHVASLPGKPDIVFSSTRSIIEVHGCFWHQHSDPTCPLSTKPRSNTGYWHAKLRRNVARDQEYHARLTVLGWRILTVWECECLDMSKLQRKIERFLGKRGPLAAHTHETC